jgi:hypothetical protein
MPALALAITVGSAQARMPQTPGAHCQDAIEVAARTTLVPSRLMAAIGLVETGRPDPASGTLHPWPWAINAEGKGFYFNSKSEAIAAVMTLQADGVRSIDVGCMQVNLQQHPNAFATLDEAFDPKRNANYAGRFLEQLFRRSGDWIIAAGWYHSTTPDLAADYAKRVTALLPPGKSSLLVTRASYSTMIFKDGAPVVGRDGVILPSVRLTSAGMVSPRPIDRYVTAKGKPGGRFGG